MSLIPSEVISIDTRAQTQTGKVVLKGKTERSPMGPGLVASLSTVRCTKGGACLFSAYPTETCMYLEAVISSFSH